MKLIECVPNFSEGRDRAVIDAITDEIAAVEGAALLDVDPGAATNRTVVTFVGSPSAVEEAAFRAIAKAAELIDMTKHTGEHPRMGATDVCPFVPVEGATMEDCVEIARRLGERVGSELGIPVYLYEHAALDGRRSLADVRSGEYEALAARDDTPDFGPLFNASAGATAIGARQFLIAYNVNLNTTDRRLAHQVASAVRTLGTATRDSSGKIIKNERGKTVFAPGRFQEVKGVGWYIDEYDRAQVSLNLTDSSVSPMHEVFEACREEATGRGMRVTGSELVGLVPLEAMLAAGDYFLEAQRRTTAIPEADRIRTAVMSLGLDEISEFDPNAKIVEYRFRGASEGLVTKTVTEFADVLSKDSPAPGGGSVAALAGALSAALSSMVASLTFAKQGMEETKPAMEAAGRDAQALKDWFLAAVDRDTDAFNSVLTAIRMPRKTDVDLAARDVAMAAANLKATMVPLEVLEHSVEALALALITARDGNPNSVTDAGVGAACAIAAAEGASLNVRINLDGLDVDTSGIVERHDAALAGARELSVKVAAVVEEHLGRSVDQ
ncbi:MAG: glutamate formimidoyltransferase [Actinomycetota bacterium]|nr:glutamate formimidoyltransferase [Actinomycetota bacterium]